MSIKSNGSDMNYFPKYVLITGPPGIGKTTLIQKVCKKLQESNVNPRGFYTNEIKNEFNKRSGFDIVTLDGKTAKLARAEHHTQPGDLKNFRVGEYYVFPERFEKLVCPIIKECHKGILVLDEIGKMELLSQKFQNSIVETQNKTNLVILATVPIRRKNMPLVEHLLRSANTYLFTIDKHNRDTLLNDVISQLNIQRFIKPTK